MLLRVLSACKPDSELPDLALSLLMQLRKRVSGALEKQQKAERDREVAEVKVLEVGNYGCVRERKGGGERTIS